jgi:hypothetical protein
MILQKEAVKCGLPVSLRSGSCNDTAGQDKEMKSIIFKKRQNSIL